MNQVYAASNWAASDCTKNVSLPGGDIEVATLKGLECVFSNVLNVIIRFAGIAVFIMLIVGGFSYMTSGGDPKKNQKAQQTLSYAFFGLLSIIGTWFIFLLIKNFTGIDVLNFKIF